MALNKDILKLVGASIGIFVCFFVFGALQERVTRVTYGENNEKFSFFVALVGFLCLFYYFVAQIGHLALREKKDESNKILYLCASIAYSTAMVCSNMALKWVAYPVQVVAKSAKPIPTIILTALIGKRTYTWKKYMFVVLIVVGVALFIYEDRGGKGLKEKLWYGELLLLVSLILDGLCGGLEERIRKESSPSPFSMMLAMNGMSAVILIISAFATGEAFRFIEFVSQHTEVIQHLFLMACAGGLGQIFIFYMVSTFGALPCSIVTTTRKFFTVMFSVIFFANPLQPHQWVGTIIVFGALFGDMFLNKKKPEAKTDLQDNDALQKLSDDDPDLKKIDIQVTPAK